MPLETNGENVTGCSAPTVSMYIASDVLAPPITLTLWGFDIVRSRRHWTPGSYLRIFVALPTIRLKSHTSKVEQKKEVLGLPPNSIIYAQRAACCCGSN